MDQDRLSSADVSNLLLEFPDHPNLFQLAGVLGPGGFVGTDGSLDLAGLRTRLGVRLADPQLARLSRVVRRRGRHFTWEPVSPDLTVHIRLTDPVADETEFAALVARLMTRPLPLDRPLWELLIVPATADGAPGLILRVHHALADGVGAARLAQVLFGGEPPTPRPDRAPDPTRRHGAEILESLRRVSAPLRGRVAPTVLLGPISPHRVVALVGADLGAVATAVHPMGATVNDALLCAVTGAVRAALAEAGEPVPAVMPASVPVALPERGASGNAVGVMLVPLPTGEADVWVRLSRIAAETRRGKEAARRAGTFEFTRTRCGTRLLARLSHRQRFIGLFVTHVRGPAEPFRVAGAPMRQAWGVAQVYGNVRLGVTAISSAGRLNCALHVASPALDASTLERALHTEFAALTAPRPTGDPTA
ncbi:wax ester/triacylglycerol synthase domain-containing protein [Granulicoccus phenolivorans]|uniref:wax ester/triacylglycerol synthase domain-containing protein n=1 Tax=Granulicoccus phenolivorans TaxID=266854 RepID=UPI00040419C3|nr:wax ester/triacylglycerol synthase domain-containing protein [Granulicoccus phenolivorans]